jgi:hypothetical protein
MEPCVLGLVYDPHPAAAKFFYNEVMRKGLSDHEWRKKYPEWQQCYGLGRIKSIENKDWVTIA